MTEPLRVLLVEDSETDEKLVIQELRRSGRAVEYERVEVAEAMRAALERRAWDVIISDWSMPRFSGLAALAVMKEMRVDLPFIIVSGTVGEELAVEAMRAGVRDYVLKDKLARLPAAIARELRSHEEREISRRRDEEHRKLERRYRRIIETTHEGVFISDAEGRISFTSSHLERMLGYEPGELIGKSVLSLAHEADHASVLENIARRRAGRAESGELRLKRKDGTDLWVLRSANPVTDADGRFDGIFAMLMDITDRRRAEEALRKSEAQLRQAQKMEAVGRLAGGVAHDFNNVLSVILSYAEMVASDLKADDPMRADVEEISTAGRRASELTRQLLAFSRQQVLEAKVLDLGQSVAGMEKMLRRLLGADVAVTVLLASGLWSVKADPGQIEQILMNLAVNARDAMPQGGKLTIETANVDLDDDYAGAHHEVRAGPHVMLAVSDTGVGIDPETLARIFEPFFTTKDVGKGTGLGLATVFGIVKQSGGHIWVYTEPGKGTTFRAYFPVVSGKAEDRPSERAAPESVRGSETILLVEDDDQVRALARSILRRHGYVVLEAPNAGEALLICEEHGSKIHLLLTDVVLPRMSGRQLAERLATERPEMKVLYMSGYTTDAILQHGVLDSGVPYLQKPFTPTSLTQKVREVLRGNGRTGDLRG